MSNTKSKHNIIKDDQQLSSLLARIENERFASSFQFETDELREKFLLAVIPNDVKYEEKYYYYDESKKLHISESEFGFFWISTMGLVPTDRYSDNTFVNAFEVQYEVLSTILDPAEAIYSKEDVYCVDSFNNGQLNRYSPAIWQNYIFFLELFAKAYLSVSGKKVERIHSLLAITDAVKNTMYELSHNDTLFHAYAISELESISNHIKRIPGNFNEAFVKYDANEQDSTCFLFSKESFAYIREKITICEEFIHDYSFSKNGSFYLKQGLLNRFIQNADTEFQKIEIVKNWGFLIEKQEDTNHADT